jgi:hypothetical protein
MQIKVHAASSAEITIIAQGPTFCAVCASRTADQDTVEDEVRRRGRDRARWRIAHEPMLDGRTNPRCCPHDHARRHWLLVQSKS